MALDMLALSEHTGTELRAGIDELLVHAGEVRRLLQQRGVLLVREANFADEDQVRLAAALGTVRDEGVNGIFKITLDPAKNAGADYLKGSLIWHMDGTHDQVPIFASLLSGRVLSPIGGQTEFASSYAAYDALPQAMKQRIADLKVVHSFATSMERAGVARTPQTAAHWASIPDRTHSLVWTHEDGRKSLVIGCHASHVVGMDRAQSDALLAELLAWTTQPRFVYRHEWSVGDLLMWDNTGVLHRAEPYPVDSGRLMHRTTLVGEEAFS